MNIDKMNSILKSVEEYNYYNYIIEAYRGSIVHNTFINSSNIEDIDIMSISVMPLEYYFGLQHFETKELMIDKIKEQDININSKKYLLDIVIYDIRKFVNLLLKNNPNVLSLLWLKPEFYISLSKEGELLLENKHLFSSKLCYDSYIGYAYGQLKRMTSFKKEGYMGEKRKALVEKFGFDCKNAGHLIRLLETGIEFLETGVMNVWRENNRHLIDIKEGNWTLEAVQKYANQLFDKMKEAVNKSPLPKVPNYLQAEELCINIIKSFLLERN